MDIKDTEGAEKVYYYSFQIKLVLLLFCVLCVIAGLFSILNKIGEAMAVGGLFLVAIICSVVAIKKLRDREPVLKISHEGIWTRKLGFIAWAHVVAAEVVEKNDGETVADVLQVFVFRNSYLNNEPDDELFLMVINDYYSIQHFLKKCKPVSVNAES